MKLFLTTFVRKLADLLFTKKNLDSKHISNIITALGDKVSLMKLEE